MIEETRELKYPEESEASLLDMLVVIAENLKLLILGPLGVGLLALGICYLVPQSYTSESIIALPNMNAGGVVNPAITATATAQAAAVMTSALVLDPVVVSLNMSEGRPIQVARKKLANQVKATVGKDGLLRLDTTANTPEEAQNIGNAVISAWLKTSIPGAEERADLEKRLESAKSSLDAVERLLKRITTEGASNLTQPLTRGEAGTSIVAIGELQTKFLGEVLSIPRALQGYSREVVKQPPTLPTESVAPKKGLIAVLATLGSGLLLLVGLLFRWAWQTAGQNAMVAKKQSELLEALGTKG
jgi:capsular polysaccharide biosynthesis protein